MEQTADILRAMVETGPLTASRLLTEAAAPNHPLHEYFDWDNDHAAHQYRLNQARAIIVSVKEVPSGAKRPIPVFIHIPSKSGEGEYALSGFVVSRPDLIELARGQVLKYLSGAQDNMDELAEALRVHGKKPGRNLAEARVLVKRAQTKIAKTRRVVPSLGRA